MATHKDIRIPFTVEGRRYEAVGFLNEGELAVRGDEMLSRTAGENGGAIGEEDEIFLRGHLEESPAELRRYYLTTGWRYPNDPRFISYFKRDDGRWYHRWGKIDGQWSSDVLVLRRCA